jgi:hypothetical protein
MSFFGVQNVIPASIRQHFPDPAPLRKVGMRTLLAVAGEAYIASGGHHLGTFFPIGVVSLPAACTMIPTAGCFKAAKKIAEYMATGDVSTLAQGLVIGSLSIAGWAWTANWGDNLYGIFEIVMIDRTKYNRRAQVG